MKESFVKQQCSVRLVRTVARMVGPAASMEVLPVLLVTVHAIARLGTKAFCARRQ